ncbi:MAG: hypothetical protein HOP17_03895 [Acidobacteria bacterium]|nr:hypothetical protein [Acidobacteriota bacterium]
MKKYYAVLAAIFLTAICVSAQSLKPDSPFPLKEGINSATSDSLVGTHYWYFYAAPGNSLVTVRLKQPTTLYGAQMKTALTVTLTDAKKTWRSTKVLTASPKGSEITFAADKVMKQQTIIIAVTPPNQNLIRMGGDYEIEVTGSVMFNGTASEADPVVRTYDSKMNSYGATKFLADGTIIASDGTRGTWKSFDPESRLYTVVIGAFSFSVQYRAGYGLVNPSEPNLIIFQEIRR